MDAIVRRTIFYVLFLVVLVSRQVNQSTAADRIPSGEKLSWNQTIVSELGVFELGFFSPGNSNRHYLGIWYKKLSDRTVVWVANREQPIYELEESFLKVTEDGNLVLFRSHHPIWSSNISISTASASEAILLDTGNFVIGDSRNNSIIRWQYYPTDTLLPGARVGMNKVTGNYQVFTSWKNSEDPAPGPFSMSLDPDGSNQIVMMWKRSHKYWESGVWKGGFYTGDAQLRAESSHFRINFYDEKTEKYQIYTVLRNSRMARTVLEPSGTLKVYVWTDDDQKILPVWARPSSQCDVYSLCGANGVCGETTPPCQCFNGFQPVSQAEWKLKDWSSGCERRSNLECTRNYTANGGVTDGFMAISGVRKPVNPEYIEAEGIEECRSACLRNCTCTAFSYANGCSIWLGDLWNLRYTGDVGNDSNTTLYIRVAASELVSRNHRNNTHIAVLICAAALVAAVTCSILAWIVMKSSTPPSAKGIDGYLIRFTYSTLQQVTKNFSDRLGGGSFGSVFKGTFPDSTIVAVKKLDHAGQGDKQFLAEVSSLGTIQHLNLVRLHGFCVEKDKRLLVYEYMPHGSLASQLFNDSSQCVDWQSRYNIALQTAKGLTYLHEECRKCIIHCDIKPENILLDADYRPKVADLGLAKILGRDFSRVLTTMRGTIGYLAPEWISGMPITQKADVYSYGMMLLEIISGKRNSDHPEGMNGYFFPIWVAKQINQGAYLSMADERLRGNINEAELIKACKAACWCIQDDETDRPSMRQIVQILEGILDLGIPPVPLLLQTLVEDYNTGRTNFPKIVFYPNDTDSSSV